MFFVFGIVFMGTLEMHTRVHAHYHTHKQTHTSSLNESFVMISYRHMRQCLLQWYMVSLVLFLCKVVNGKHKLAQCWVHDVCWVEPIASPVVTMAVHYRERHWLCSHHMKLRNSICRLIFSMHQATWLYQNVWCVFWTNISRCLLRLK